mgnify:CR=1 FL=1
MNARVDTSPKVADEVKTTTCYMCACRCGIKVHLKDGKVRYIQGNPDHPVNKGVLCAKGSAGIMQQYSPAKLSKPLLRVGERGSGEFKEIEWSEAIQTAIDWLKPIREEDPSKLAFFTGRDQSQALTGCGRRNSARRIMRRMAAFVPSIWRPAVYIPSAVRSGNSANRIGNAPST